MQTAPDRSRPHDQQDVVPVRTELKWLLLINSIWLEKASDHPSSERQRAYIEVIARVGHELDGFRIGRMGLLHE
ncbi:hypothetical protein GCM10027200_48080 [Lentzea nigeriaca]